MRSRRRSRKPRLWGEAGLVLLLVALAVAGGYTMGEWLVSRSSQGEPAAAPAAPNPERSPEAGSEGGAPNGTGTEGPASAGGGRGTEGEAPGEPPAGEAGGDASGRAAVMWPAHSFRYLQVGAFSDRANAERLAASLRSSGWGAAITGAAPYRVIAGAAASREGVAGLAGLLPDGQEFVAAQEEWPSGSVGVAGSAAAEAAALQGVIDALHRAVTESLWFWDGVGVAGEPPSDRLRRWEEAIGQARSGWGALSPEGVPAAWRESLPAAIAAGERAAKAASAWSGGGPRGTAIDRHLDWIAAASAVR